MMATAVDLFDYDLPEELIAQFPTRRRDQSRLFVYDRRKAKRSHRMFRDLTDYLRPGDALVINNTKVFKARLLGRRSTGAQVEVFLVRQLNAKQERWHALTTLTRRLKEGEEIHFGERHRVTLEKKLEAGQWEVSFSSRTMRERTIQKFGHVPLPHYIERDDRPTDIRRYQTVFAVPEKTGAVAAPTAGFHFTPSLLDEIREMGVFVIEVTLHVGPGTFKPIQVDSVEDHVVDPEFAELSETAATTINRVRNNGGAVMAVGTTTVRTLESAPLEDGRIQPFARMVDLYIRPGHKFRVVDHLVTNFHLPKSSLLVLVSAFAGRETVLDLYREAIDREYRFYSYGDAMLLL